VENVPDRPGVAATIFRALADEGVNVDMIVQNVSHGARTDVSFTAPKQDLPIIGPVVERVVKEVGAAGFVLDDGIAKVSLVGAGMKTNPGVAAAMFQALSNEGVNIEMISTSSIRVSVVVRAADADRAVRAIHAKFSLPDEAAGREDHE